MIKKTKRWNFRHRWANLFVVVLLLLWTLPGASASAAEGIGPDPALAKAAASSVNGTPLPDTGQTQSYITTFGEDSDYLINPPSYTKLDAGGNDLADTAMTWRILLRNG